MPLDSRRDFLFASPFAAALGVAAMTPAHGGVSSGSGGVFDVTAFGASGDGDTPCAEAFQQAIDAAEGAGGGVVWIPAGVFLLEKTPFIASRVHVMGVGAASVLRGVRPPGSQGAALISNKGQQAAGFEGASDWSISRVAIDSPDTNGIVVTHAARVHISHIYGVEVFHHFMDIVGRDVLCENLFLTGRSGTSSFQVDSVSSAQTIWDGEQAVAPLRDGTDAENVLLRNSIITAVAGHTGDKPQHRSSIHFHGDEARGFLFSDLVVGGADIGFYQDAGSAYHDLHISNVRCASPERAVWLLPGHEGQRRLMIRGLTHEPTDTATDGTVYRGLEIHGREEVTLSDVQLSGDAAASADFAILIAGARQARISGVQARGKGGRGILLRDGAQPVDRALVQGCMLRGFDVGCSYDGDATAVLATGNSYSDVATPTHGVRSQE